MANETMEFDIIIVGAGPAGLSCACKLAQLSQASDDPGLHGLSICVVEKGADIGAHILSGALFETTALDELFPEWSESGAPVETRVSSDRFLYLTTALNFLKVPHMFTPEPMRNSDKNYVISLGNLCRWLAEQAESLGVEIYPGFAASGINYDSSGAVSGITTCDMGLDKEGEPKPGYEPGVELKARYTLFAEGSRGHLGKELIRQYRLDKACLPQHYALGLKEIWDITALREQDGSAPEAAGSVIHFTGWPLSESETGGGGFLYYLNETQVAVGLILDLNYSNPYLSPFDEFQRLKHHPAISRHLKGGERIAYGARALSKGGLNALPQQAFPGGVLIGCDAGTLNVGKMKGCHTAMKSGMLAAEAVFDQLLLSHSRTTPDYEAKFRSSWLWSELNATRNFGAQLHRFGPLFGGSMACFEHNIWQPIFRSGTPWKVRDKKQDHLCLKTVSESEPLHYPKPDGVLSFDKPSSLYLSGTMHEENQPCHLLLEDPRIPVETNLEKYDEPAQRYCPAGVYEITEKEGKPELVINAANCLHCKTCDIKDPEQNITWVPPEGGGGPGYTNM